MDGLLVIDKPAGVTSRDAVNRVQRWLPRRTKLGHTGTLDPMATGVLVLCVGKATRLAEYVQAMPKAYTSTFRLGATSTTDDADGDVARRPGVTPLGRAGVEAALAGFVGEIEQVPPAFSAMKVTGKRAYDLARSGQAVQLEARPVRVDRIDVLDFAWPDLHVEVACGKGTYIRSIARDLGEALGCGGHVTALRRTAVGPFRAEDGVGIEGPPADVAGLLRPLDEAVGRLPRVELTADQADAVRHGRPVKLAGPPGEAAAFAADGLAAIVEVDAAGSARPAKVF